MEYVFLITLLFGLIILVNGGHTGQDNKPFLQLRTITDDNFIYHANCFAYFPPESLDYGPTCKWIYSKKTITKNSTVIGATRYSVRYAFIENKAAWECTLSIQNALKSDKGLYKCHFEYYINQKHETLEKEVNVPIPNYLPSLNYPECATAPSTKYNEGDKVTFNCTTGKSSPAVDLELVLKQPDNTSIYLGNTTTSTIVTAMDYNNSLFICYMSSSAFPTGGRNCTAGPITILPSETNSIESTAQTTYIAKTSNLVSPTKRTSDVVDVSTTEYQLLETSTERPTNEDKSGNISTTEFSLMEIICLTIGVVSVFSLVTIICTIALFNKCKSTRDPNTESTIRSNDHGIRAQNQNPPLTNPTSNTGLIPFYAVVHKDKANAKTSLEETSKQSATPAYEDTTFTIEENGQNAPIYYEVNRSERDEDDDYDSGLIDNIIYVSAGPK